MGVSMKYARLAQNNLRVSASEYQSTCGSVICNYCSAQVYHKKSYKKGLNTIVPAHFCIWPRQEHEQTCLYNLDRVGREILAGVADNSISKDGNCYTIRLLLAESIDSKIDGGEENLNEKSKTKEPIYQNGWKISPYIQSLHKLITIRRLLLDGCEDFHNTFKLKWNKQFVSWRDFVFEEEDFPRLYNCIKDGNLYHPVCVVGKYEVFPRTIRGEEKFKIQFKYSHDENHYCVECFLDPAMAELLKKREKEFAVMYVDHIKYRDNKNYKNIDCRISSIKQIFVFDE